MSFRIKRESSLNQPENLKKETLRSFINRYNSRVQEDHPTVYSQNSSSQSSSIDLHSPKHIKITKKSTHYTKHSEPTLADYTNSSISDISASDYQNLFENQPKTRIRRVHNSAYSSELESCRREIGKLRVKLTQKKETNAKKQRTEDPYLYSSKEVAKKLKTQKEHLLKQYDLKLSQQRAEKIKELENERKNRKEKFQDFFQDEISTAEKEFEKQLNLKLGKIEKEFDRSFQRIQEENSALKKQNEKLRRQIEDSIARDEIMGNRTRGTMRGNREAETELKELREKIDELQRDYTSLKKKSKNVLCVKCKAFAKVDLNIKIEKTKYF